MIGNSRAGKALSVFKNFDNRGRRYGAGPGARSLGEVIPVPLEEQAKPGSEVMRESGRADKTSSEVKHFGGRGHRYEKKTHRVKGYAKSAGSLGEVIPVPLEEQAKAGSLYESFTR